MVYICNMLTCTLLAVVGPCAHDQDNELQVTPCVHVLVHHQSTPIEGQRQMVGPVSLGESGKGRIADARGDRMGTHRQ